MSAFCPRPPCYCLARGQTSLISELQRPAAAPLLPGRGAISGHVARLCVRGWAAGAKFLSSVSLALLARLVLATYNLPPPPSLQPTLTAWVGSSAAARSPSTLTARSISTTLTSIVLSGRALSARCVLATRPFPRSASLHVDNRSESSSTSGRSSFTPSSTSTRPSASNKRPLLTSSKNGGYSKRCDPSQDICVNI